MGPFTDPQGLASALILIVTLIQPNRNCLRPSEQQLHSLTEEMRKDIDQDNVEEGDTTCDVASCYPAVVYFSVGWHR